MILICALRLRCPPLNARMLLLNGFEYLTIHCLKCFGAKLLVSNPNGQSQISSHHMVCKYHSHKPLKVQWAFLHWLKCFGRFLDNYKIRSFILDSKPAWSSTPLDIVARQEDEGLEGTSVDPQSVRAKETPRIAVANIHTLTIPKILLVVWLKWGHVTS
jgi:hypothetical protein